MFLLLAHLAFLAFLNLSSTNLQNSVLQLAPLFKPGVNDPSYNNCREFVQFSTRTPLPGLDSSSEFVKQPGIGHHVTNEVFALEDA